MVDFTECEACKDGLSDEFFVGFSPNRLNDERIYSAVLDVAQKIGNGAIYIGISWNPCGRFTGNYECMPVPPHLMTHLYKTLPPTSGLISEAAHMESYSNMYLICRSEDTDFMQDLEKEMIRFCREQLGRHRVLNVGDGGEGGIPNELTYLYVCVL